MTWKINPTSSKTSSRYGGNMDWDQKEVDQTGSYSIGPSSETLLQRYSRKLADAKKRVQKMERLIELLNNNPETMEILQLMGGL